MSLFQLQTNILKYNFKQIPELFVIPSRKSSALNESKSLPHLDITTVELQWLQVLAEGWAFPLKGFMRENEYLQVKKLKRFSISEISNDFSLISFNVLFHSRLDVTFQLHFVR